MENRCSLQDEPLWRDGKCWGRVDIVDSIDGCGVWACEGHAETYLLISNEIIFNEEAEGE